MKSLIRFVRTKVLVKHVSCCISDLLSCHVEKNEFLRYDVFIRLLAIENYYNKNNYGWRLYEKLREHQLKTDNVQGEKQRFVSLIKSFEKCGYTQSSEIYIDNNYRLIDGSHRLALSLYYGYKKIPCRMICYKAIADYSIVKLKEYDFTSNEIACIQQRYSDLLCDSHFQSKDVH